MKCYQLCSDDITELAKAMISVQSSLQPAVKDQVNPESQSRYATLNSVMEACRKTLIDNDIWLTQYPILGKTVHPGLITKLTHVKSGQWQTSCLHMPLPQDDPQGYGSAMTYARRYSITGHNQTFFDPDHLPKFGSTGTAVWHSCQKISADGFF